MKERKIPLRTCIACRTEQPKGNMMRIVKNADGELYLDVTGKAAGRGAYICRSEACLKKLEKYRLLNKAFSMEVSEEVYGAIEEEFFAKG